MKYLEARALARAKKAGAVEEKMLKAVPENKALPEPVEPPPAGEPWPMAMPPAWYIALNAESDNPEVQAKVALARRILGA